MPPGSLCSSLLLPGTKQDLELASVLNSISLWEQLKPMGLSVPGPVPSTLHPFIPLIHLRNTVRQVLSWFYYTEKEILGGRLNDLPQIPQLIHGRAIICSLYLRGTSSKVILSSFCGQAWLKHQRAFVFTAWPSVAETRSLIPSTVTENDNTHCRDHCEDHGR